MNHCIIHHVFFFPFLTVLLSNALVTNRLHTNMNNFIFTTISCRSRNRKRRLFIGYSHLQNTKNIYRYCEKCTVDSIHNYSLFSPSSMVLSSKQFVCFITGHLVLHQWVFADSSGPDQDLPSRVQPSVPRQDGGRQRFCHVWQAPVGNGEKVLWGERFAAMEGVIRGRIGRCSESSC